MKFRILNSCICELALSMPNLRLFMTRHQNGDWGNVSAVEHHDNQLFIREGGRVTSRFPVGGMQLVMVSTVKAGFASTQVSLIRPENREVTYGN